MARIAPAALDDPVVVTPPPGTTVVDDRPWLSRLLRPRRPVVVAAEPVVDSGDTRVNWYRRRMTSTFGENRLRRIVIGLVIVAFLLWVFTATWQAVVVTSSLLTLLWVLLIVTAIAMLIALWRGRGIIGAVTAFVVLVLVLLLFGALAALGDIGPKTRVVVKQPPGQSVVISGSCTPVGGGTPTPAACGNLIQQYGINPQLEMRDSINQLLRQVSQLCKNQPADPNCQTVPQQNDATYGSIVRTVQANVDQLNQLRKIFPR